MQKVAGALVLVGLIVGTAQAAAIRVFVDGSQVAFDQPPVQSGGRVLVPLRGIFERLGAVVVFEPRQNQITAVRGRDVILLHVGSRTATINGAARTLDTPAIQVRGRVMVPLRFVSEALGAEVTWDPSSATVTVNSSLAAVAPAVPPGPTYSRPPASAMPPAVWYVGTESKSVLSTGDSFAVSARGTPGMQAVLAFGGVTMTMGEISPGLYRIEYLVQPTDGLEAAPVTVTLRDAYGRSASMKDPVPVSMNRAERSSEPPPIENAVTIEQPAMRSDVSGPFEVDGRVAAGSQADLAIYELDNSGGRRARLVHQVQGLAPDGRFAFHVPPLGVARDTPIALEVTSKDASGRETGRSEVIATVR